MGILSLLGQAFKQGSAKPEGGNSVGLQSRQSTSTPAAEQPKAKAAAKLALIKTGGKGGVLNEATTGRKKLLGN
ncbi:hypothetical protein LCGC14_1482380 [marine sediment metagenome]|uniref:Uncharacterized protein n=1 Tax=marine sediment metagenome TaxID=412755 RepID=A0A0F9MB05_9ZZZZ